MVFHWAKEVFNSKHPKLDECLRNWSWGFCNHTMALLQERLHIKTLQAIRKAPWNWCPTASLTSRLHRKSSLRNPEFLIHGNFLLSTISASSRQLVYLLRTVLKLHWHLFLTCWSYRMTVILYLDTKLSHSKHIINSIDINPTFFKVYFQACY